MKIKEPIYVIGVDFGTDSVRAVIVNAAGGNEVAASVCPYSRWKAGLFCNPSASRFRQHPLDYAEGLEESIRACLRKAGKEVAAQVKAISVDTTGSTPVAADSNGTPLALLPAFAENPNAMFVLWKDHTAIREATAINDHAKQFAENYLKYCGGIYSSEWYWAKALHILRQDAAVRDACFTWVEHCDWIPFLLTGGSDARRIKRSRCAAGHKALWAETFGGYPPDRFFSELDPLLAGYRDRLGMDTCTADQPAGNLGEEWAGRLGLSTDVLVGCGAFDAHMGAAGGQIAPYYLSKVMGTSTCDMMVVPAPELGQQTVAGICGQVNGSVIPGLIGLEAGQSAFGDTYAWFRDLLLWPLELVADPVLKEQLSAQLIPELSRLAAALPPDENAELAVDWLNGRRTPDANQNLQAGLTGLQLGTDAPRIFRALAESTCFGARAIVERFREQGVPVKGITGIGGVAKKSPYIMQMLADVLQMPIRIHSSGQTCALGAAMFAATVAGIYPDVQQAMQAMGAGFEKTYGPDPAVAAFYDRRYRRYQLFGNFMEQVHEYI